MVSQSDWHDRSTKDETGKYHSALLLELVHSIWGFEKMSEVAQGTHWGTCTVCLRSHKAHIEEHAPFWSESLPVWPVCACLREELCVGFIRQRPSLNGDEQTMQYCQWVRLVRLFLLNIYVSFQFDPRRWILLGNNYHRSCNCQKYSCAHLTIFFNSTQHGKRKHASCYQGVLVV